MNNAEKPTDTEKAKSYMLAMDYGKTFISSNSRTETYAAARDMAVWQRLRIAEAIVEMHRNGLTVAEIATAVERGTI